ncbi:MAG: YcgN family cysteine cluster protein [Rhizobiales bacterium]|nr:YcgN family cysteine cluster protein [Hyphomicrobiales bacterium]
MTEKKPAADAPFWRTKSLDQMSDAEWESLCDGCGRCCLVKLEEEIEGEDGPGPIHYTSVGCRLLLEDTCRCADYPNRQSRVPDCVRLTPQTVRTIRWLPPTCGYRLVAERRDLPWWHPLVSGNPETVHEAGVSARGRVAVNEDDIPDDQSVDFIVTWPTRWPRGAKGPVPPPQILRDRRAREAAPGVDKPPRRSYSPPRK